MPERAQVGDLPGPVGWVHRQGGEDLDLGPVLLVLAPLAGQLGPLAGLQVPDRARGDELLAGIVTDLDHREAVVLGHPDHMDDFNRAVEAGLALE